MPEEPSVLYREKPGIGVLTLNRPARLNSMTGDLLSDVLGSLERVSVDERIRVLVLTGAGQNFCAGGDLKEGLRSINGDPPLASQARRLRSFMRTSQLLREMPAVTIAAIDGACVGAGLAWAAACDMRYASTRAVFATAFLSAGVSGDFGGTWTLPRIVGEGRARELYLTGRRFDALEAERIGLVSAVFDAQVLQVNVDEIARRLAAAAPRALRAVKANFNDSSRESFSGQLDAESTRHAELCESRDAHEAAEAFIAKRRPMFTGS